MRNTLEDAIKSTGLETEIRNVVFHLVRNTLSTEQQKTQEKLSLSADPLGYLRRAAVQWDRRVRKSLNAMCAELSMPLQGQPRAVMDRDELISKWDELSNYNIGKWVLAITKGRIGNGLIDCYKMQLMLMVTDFPQFCF